LTLRAIARARLRDQREALNRLGERYRALESGTSSTWDELKTSFSDTWTAFSEAWSVADEDASPTDRMTDPPAHAVCAVVAGGAGFRRISV